MKKKFLGLAVVAILVLSFVLVSTVRADNSNSSKVPQGRMTTMLLKGVPFRTAATPATTTVKFHSREVELQKIDSPAQLRNFRVMKRIDHTLYGLSLDSFHALQNQLRQARENSNQAIKGLNNSKSSEQLEKIAAPQFIKLFKRIRRIGNALWGIRKNPQMIKHLPTPNRTIKFVKIQPDQVSCVSAAIRAKDEAISSRLAAAASSLAAAINARTNCQISALSASDQQAALNKCVQNFQASRQKINKNSQELRQQTWKTFRASLQACRSKLAPSQNASSTATSSVLGSQNNQNSEQITIPDGGNTTVSTLINNGASQ